MFSGRLPDHLLQASAVPDEAAGFEAIVEDKEPLNTILTKLYTEKTRLDQRTEYNPNGCSEVLRTPQPFRFVD